MIGHSLESCTRDVKLIKFRCPQRKNTNFVFVDTPAFDYDTKTHLDVLQTDVKRLNALCVISCQQIAVALTFIAAVSERKSRWPASYTSTLSLNIRRVKFVQIS